MPSRRQNRIAELIHTEVSKLLQFKIRDPRIGFVTVTSVEVTPDLKVATIYVSFLSGDPNEILAGLNSATPYFRRELAQRVKLQYMPVLRFRLDLSLAYAQEIEALLSQINIPPETDE